MSGGDGKLGTKTNTMTNLNPSARTDLHGWFLKYLIIISSAFGGFYYILVVSVGAVVYHLRDLASGREKGNRPREDNSIPEYTVREPYPDLDKMKITKDLNYYAKLLGLELKEHTITTGDGFNLVLHHLIDPKDSDAERDAKPPIILQHGLLSCSGAWLTPGRNSLAYYFMEQGYDVWMGNNRCGFKPDHATLKGHLMHNEHYWDWDVRHMAGFDLPCIIDNVLSHKPQHTQVYLAGHSQGCTQTVLMLRNEDMAEHHAKIKHFFALAPAIFPGKLFHERRFIKFIHNRSPTMYKVIFGNCCFLTFLGTCRRLIGTTRIFKVFSYQLFKYLFGWNIRNSYHDDKVIHVQFLYNVSFISARLMSWWLSHSVKEGFSNQLQPKKAYEDGSTSSFTPVSTKEDSGATRDAQELHKLEKEIVSPSEEDADEYTFFPYKSQWFTFSEKSKLVPMTVFIGGVDFLVDGKRFVTHMNHYEHGYYEEGRNLDVYELPDYNHLDVIWASNCIGRIGQVIQRRIEEYNTPV